MQEEAAQGLFDGQCHQLLLVAMRGVVPTEDDLAIAESDEPVVGDGGAMGVCAEIAQCVLGAAAGALGVYDPFLAKQGAQKLAKGARFGQMLEAAVKVEVT
jgi:hypothetical protein